MGGGPLPYPPSWGLRERIQSDITGELARRENQRRESERIEAEARAASEAAATAADLRRSMEERAGVRPTRVVPPPTIAAAVEEAMPPLSSGGARSPGGEPRTADFLPGGAGEVSYQRDFRPESEKLASLRAGAYSRADRPQEQAIADLQNRMLDPEFAQSAEAADRINDAFGGWDRAREDIFGPTGDVVPFDPEVEEFGQAMQEAGVSRGRALAADPFAEERIKSRYGEAVEAARIPGQTVKAQGEDYGRLLDELDQDYQSQASKIQVAPIPEIQKQQALQVLKSRRDKAREDILIQTYGPDALRRPQTGFPALMGSS